MKKLSSKGFTLIELLVVITIIGILATGATAVYTSAQQKARDSIRQNDLLALKSATEQVFGDDAFYPNATELKGEVVGNGYMQDLPSDPKTGQKDGDTYFHYLYAAADDESTLVAGQEYEFSANFENTGNATTKEVNTADGGNDAVRWEIGINMDHVNTNMADTQAADTCEGTNTYDSTAAVVCDVVDTQTS